jgi:hypothetical protein
MVLSLSSNMTSYRYGQGVNVASQASGASASASSTLGSNIASHANDGDRGGATGVWIGATAAQQWLQVNFSSPHLIDEVDIFMVQDSTPVEPTQELTFGLNGLLSFDVQFWDGAGWVSILKVRNNFRVWRRLIFPEAVTTSRIRILSQSSVDGMVRIAEVEAWAQVADSGFPEITASGNVGTVHWSVNAGRLDVSTGPLNKLFPLNRTQVVTVTAQDDATTVSKNIQVYGTLPTGDGQALQPKWAVEAEAEIPMATWPMVYEKRDFAEYLSVLEFFNWHKKCVVDTSPAEDEALVIRVVKGLPFYIKDISLGELQQVYFDSSIRRSPQAADWVDYAFSLRSFNYLAP